MKQNGRAKKVEVVVDAVMEALQERREQAESAVDLVSEKYGDTVKDAGADAGDAVREAGGVAAEKLKDAGDVVAERAGAAATAIKDVDLADKIDRIMDFLEQNAGLVSGIARRLAGEAVTQAPAAAAAVGEAMGDAAATAGEVAGDAMEAIGDAAGDALEAFGEEVVQPVAKYGRGLRHGLVIGGVIALLVTPWPGNVVRAKLKAAGREALDLINALREGAADGGSR